MEVWRSLKDTLAYAGWAREHDACLNNERILAERYVTPALAEASEPVFTLCISAATPGPGSTAALAVETLRNQSFPGWEAYVAPQLDHGPGTGRLTVFAEGLGEIEQCRSALDQARGRYFIVVPPRVSLHPDALWLLAGAILDGNLPAIVYTDSDRVDAHGNRIEPRLRTGWDPDLVLGRDAIGPVYAVRTEDARRAGGYHPQATLDAELYDLMLRVSDRIPPDDIRHVPAVLWHSHGWLDRDSLADGEASRSVVRCRLLDRGERASVTPAPLLPAGCRVHWELPSPTPLVSVILPIRDRAELLSCCAEGLLQRTSYEALELLIVDNGSVEPATLRLLAKLASDHRVRVIQYPGAFNFSAMSNHAVRQARGDVVVFLNNDTDVIGAEWLSELVSQTMRPDVGAVGAKLLYHDGRVQHCGLSAGPDGALAHQFRFADRYEPGPQGELALGRTVMAVTGACLATRTSVFWEAGGFDEQFAVAFNDVDLCLRLGDLGYRIVCTPFAELFHLESATRGADDTPAKLAVAASEFAQFRELWDPLLEGGEFESPHVVFRWNDVMLRPPRARLPGSHERYLDMSRDLEGLKDDHVDTDGPEPEVGTEALLRARAVSRTREARRYARRLQEDVKLHKGEVETLRLQLEQHAAALQNVQSQLAASIADRAHLEALHQQVLQSTVWKASWPIRRIGGKLPADLRQGVVRITGLLWPNRKRTRRN